MLLLTLGALDNVVITSFKAPPRFLMLSAAYPADFEPSFEIEAVNCVISADCFEIFAKPDSSVAMLFKALAELTSLAVSRLPSFSMFVAILLKVRVSILLTLLSDVASCDIPLAKLLMLAPLRELRVSPSPCNLVCKLPMALVACCASDLI